MCGRFTRKSTIKKIAETFQVEEIACDLAPSYNIAPRQYLASILKDSKVRLVALRWGLIPGWAKEATIGDRMINARAETIIEKPSFKSAFFKRRCLIVAEGFYEWKKEGPQKIPMYIHLEGHPLFAFAGIWESWRTPEKTTLETCTIITTEANEFLRSIHHRMPVILPKDQQEEWLNPKAERDSLLALLKPFPVSEMRAYPVSTWVNAPKNNSPKCMEPENKS